MARLDKASASRRASKRKKHRHATSRERTASAPVVPYAVAGVFAVLGAALGAYVSALTASHAAQEQERRRHADSERDVRAVRLSTVAALRDLIQYARIAATRAHFNARIWQPSVDALVERVTNPRTVNGFSDDEWPLVAAAASEARLGLLRLQSIARNPFITGLDRTNSEVDAEQMEYVQTIYDVGQRTHSALANALRKTTDHDEEPLQASVPDLVSALRAVHGQPPVHVTRWNPGERFERARDA
jgi:hypothetical protein